MIKRWIVLIVAFFSLVGFGSPALALEPFKITEYLTDQAGILSQAERDQISEQLWNFDKRTGNQILVVVIPTLEDEELVDFTEKLFELNRPGQKGKDNGSILLIALQERKIRIETGYGHEESIPDGRAGNIIRNEIAPGFAKGDYYAGISSGVNAMIAAIGDPGQPESGRSSRKQSFPAALIVALLIFILSAIFGNRGYNDHRRRYRRGYSEPWFWGGPGSGGGFGGGSGFGGGGFSGGGGSFGGGGASGGW